MDLITLTLAVKKALEELGVKKELGKVLWKGKLEATGDGLSTASLDNPIGLEVGKTYTVTTDSGTYTSIAKEYGNTIVIGNTAMMGGDDSGESYCIVEAVAGEAGAILDINGGTSATISAPETIHPIDPKFIPGAKVIDLSQYELLYSNGTPVGSFADVILGKFAASGGNETGIDGSGFWDAVNTDRTIKFILDATALGAIVEAPAQTVTKDASGIIGIIETSFMVLTDAWYRVTLVFSRVTEDTTISVLVASV